MDQQELDRYLHQVEDYEKLHYGEYQDFLIETGYAEADESERSRIRKEKEEEAWKEYQRIWDGNSVVLSYKLGEANQLVKPESRNMHETVLLSRSLVTEQDGIRKWMIIQKHPRFSVTFNHAHSFVEINYCYSGTVSNYINGHPYIMRPGDLVIMEPGCYHSIGLVGDDDILINFLLFPSAMATLMDKVIPGDSELSRFLLGALERGFGKNNYVSLRTSEDPRIAETLNEIICEYTEEDRTASEAMTGFLVQELFARLWRFSAEKPELVEYGYAPDNKAVQILHFIREHAADCNVQRTFWTIAQTKAEMTNISTVKKESSDRDFPSFYAYNEANNKGKALNKRTNQEEEIS